MVMQTDSELRPRQWKSSTTEHCQELRLMTSKQSPGVDTYREPYPGSMHLIEFTIGFMNVRLSLVRVLVSMLGRAS